MFRVFNAAKPLALEAVENALHQLLFKVAIQQPLSSAIQDFVKDWKDIKVKFSQELKQPETFGFFSIISKPSECLFFQI